MNSSKKKVEMVRAVRELKFSQCLEEMGADNMAKGVTTASVRKGTLGIIVGLGYKNGTHKVTFQYGKRSTVTADVTPDDIVHL